MEKAYEKWRRREGSRRHKTTQIVVAGILDYRKPKGNIIPKCKNRFDIALFCFYLLSNFFNSALTYFANNC